MQARAAYLFERGELLLRQGVEAPEAIVVIATEHMK